MAERVGKALDRHQELNVSSECNFKLRRAVFQSVEEYTNGLATFHLTTGSAGDEPRQMYLHWPIVNRHLTASLTTRDAVNETGPSPIAVNPSRQHP